MRGRVTLVAGFVALVAAASAVGILAAGDDPAATATGGTEKATVTVERRTLRDEERVSGELGYADARTVSPSAAQGVLTALPAEGRVVRRGEVAYRVDDQPVVLLTGRLPLWRDLSYGVDDGADVAQLERNLESLGYDPGTVDDSFTTYTREAVEDLQADVGAEETGAVTASAFLVLPDAIRVGASQAEIGARLAPGTPLYGATSTRKLVTIDLDPSDEALAAVGTTATITLPDGSTAKAKITAVGTVAEAAGDDDSGEPTAEATIPVTLKLNHSAKAEGLSAAPVTVDLARTTRKDVLAVPVTALVALAEGGFGIRREGGELIGVEPGLYSAGFVEITDGLAAGDRIEVPS